MLSWFKHEKSFITEYGKSRCPGIMDKYGILWFHHQQGMLEERGSWRREYMSSSFNIAHHVWKITAVEKQKHSEVVSTLNIQLILVHSEWYFIARSGYETFSCLTEHEIYLLHKC